MTPEGRYLARMVDLWSRSPRGPEDSTVIHNQRSQRNFTLRLESVHPNADSGVFIRDPQLQCRDFPLAGAVQRPEELQVGEWNQLEVVVKNGVAHCTCNGEVIEEALKVPESGPIGLEGDRGQL